MANYYNEINRMIEKIAHKVLISDKRKFKVARKNQEFSLLEMFIIKKIGKNEIKSIYELVKEMEIDRGLVTSIIKKLVITGYIKKEKAQEDKRVNMLRLTVSGKEIYNEIIVGQQEFFEFILSDVTLNEEKAILKFLSKINQKIY
ncbi:MarR family winged helix-turn-helix transcriptional regulator [Maledivibacter halophilus]|uniref:DNA-binding transcriptional regulator, MarR family n=1 Tax=Maledivibacter halophilus TaxID=36842 RepID=A0A1T5JUQ4_9FIRM|nr:MarR family transcriptional regulator [Maledivibacter halophilus]SKC55252.1 DNA-binding transcriptional regulator, MarR family [Maledivibacter halophilus]